MALPNVNISIANGQLGRVATTNDGVAGLLCSGTATVELPLSTPVQLFSFDQLAALGVTEVNNPLVYKEVKAFYNQAGNGAELWLMTVADTVLFADLCDKDKAYAPKLINAASGTIRILGINRIPAEGYTPTFTEGLDQDVIAGLALLQTSAEASALNYKPFRALLPGLGFTKAAVSTLKDLTLGSSNRCAIVLGCDSATSAAIGLTLGRLASIPVQRKIARVKDGDVGILHAYFPDGTPTTELELSWGAIHDKGYIFFRRIYGKSGFFFTDDPTATSITDDYGYIGRGRVIDKALVIAYATFIEQLNDEIPVDAQLGKVAPALIASWKADIESALSINMVATQEIVKATCYIDPSQNVLASDTINATISILPVGYAKYIQINLGLSNPFKAS